MRIFLFIITLWFNWAQVLANESLVLIAAANSPLENLSLETVKLIYLRKEQISADGLRWVPVNLPVADPLRRGFSQALFQVLPEEQDEYWNAQYFNGIMPPKVMTSEEAVLRFVETTPGAIGYIRKQKVDERVKVLFTVVVK